MATVLLDWPDLSLFADPENYRVVLRRLTTQTPSKEGAETFVQFEGNRAETSFRGELSITTWDLEAVFASDEHQGAADLIELLRYAYEDAPDARLILRTRIGQVPGLDPIQVVRVPPTWSPVPQPGNFYRVRFTARSVDYTEEV